MLTAAHIAFLSVIATLGPIAHAAEAEQQVQTIEPGVRSALASVGIIQVKSPIKRTKVSVQFLSRAGAQPSELESRYEQLSDGLWGIVSTLKRVKGMVVAQGVSVCGMFDALTSTSGSETIEGTGILPIGKIFVPFGMKSSLTSDSITKLTKLVVDPPALCAPVPGAAFDYVTQTEFQYKVSAGLGGVGRTVTVSINGRCEVSQKMPAVKLQAGIRGDFLEVTCVGTTDAGKSLTRRFAYLIDSALYFLLESKAESSHFTHTFVDVEYEN